MDSRSTLVTSGAALGMLAIWWAGILYLDGLFAGRFPYDQYEMLTLLYPDIFYPALPGWILAHGQPFSIGVWLVAIGWMILLGIAIGAGATRYASRRDQSPTITAATAVCILFVAITLIEAAISLLS